MKQSVRFLILILLLGSGCASITSTLTTYSRVDGALVLTVQRHKDEILYAPDTDEDQTLVLELKNYKIGERLKVPSDKAVVHFDVDRFGASSHGDEYAGYVIVKSDNESLVKAYIKITLQARTDDNTYKQHEVFNGDYVFSKAVPRNY
jgi:hypothetical protein